MNSFLCLNLFFAERQSYVHIYGYNVRVERRAAVQWMLALYSLRDRSNALLGST